MRLLVCIGSASKKVDFVIERFCMLDDLGEHMLIGCAYMVAILLIK